MATEKLATESAGTVAIKKMESAKERTATAASKKTTSKAAKPESGKRVPNAAFMKPVTPTAVLAAIVGEAPLPRTEVTKKIWAYIKQNGLQDKDNRRMINADAKLEAVFGGKKQVSMFEMTKLISAHLK